MKTKNTQNNRNSQNTLFKKESYSKNGLPVKKSILSIGVTTAKKEEIVSYILHSLKNSSKSYYISTPNPEMVVYAASHPDFKAILNASEIALCDGIGLWWGAKVLGKPLLERFAGVELVEKLCEGASKETVTVGFFGGKKGVAEKATECLRSKYPDLQVVFADSTWKEGSSDQKEVVSSKYQVVRKEKMNNIHTTNYKLPATGIDILFVALGFPKQEQWMAEHLNKIPVRVMVGVGGALDYISGKVPRAPLWVQNIGFEWLFRLVVQPWRIKRQLALPKFVWMVLREKLSFRKTVGE